uniref:ITPR-interacting domain-containing protein n=1 Tax=Eptatretus burgeri TaxID=7764 RepID=A0A8C4X1L7_EPTBU
YYGLLNSTSSYIYRNLHREDPEEVLYNLGFGHHEPHVGEKVPARFFTGHSTAQGIDFRLFLECQMQRLNYENSSLANRFRQVEVLVNVADAFSSLYSRVSGTPIQHIRKAATMVDCGHKTTDRPSREAEKGERQEYLPRGQELCLWSGAQVCQGRTLHDGRCPFGN